MNALHLAHVLLIDDDQDDIHLFEEALSVVSPESILHSFNSCYEALRHIENLSIPIPDVFFIDLVMPAISGFDCISRIKKNELLKDIPIMVLSSSITAINLDRLYKMGVSFFITKPPSFDQLKIAINNMVNLPTRNDVQTKENFHFKQ